MNVLVCVKRVPLTGGKIVLTGDERAIETRHLGFTISPHEECGVEEAVRIVEAHGCSTTVLTLGPPEAEEQLRDQLAIGADRAIHLVTDGLDWDPESTAAALVDAKGRRSYVTSAGAGPSLGKHILMAYLPPEHAVAGAELAVEYLGERYPVTVAVAGATPVFDPENMRIRS